MKTAPTMQWFDDPGVAEVILQRTGFDRSSTRDAPVSRDTRFVMHLLMEPAVFLGLAAKGQLDERVIEKYAEVLQAAMKGQVAGMPYPWLQVNHEEKAVVSHEGRHRMAAAHLLGLPTVPVVLVLRPKDYDLVEEDIPLVHALLDRGITALWGEGPPRRTKRVQYLDLRGNLPRYFEGRW